MPSFCPMFLVGDASGRIGGGVGMRRDRVSLPSGRTIPCPVLPVSVLSTERQSAQAPAPSVGPLPNLPVRQAGQAEGVCIQLPGLCDGFSNHPGGQKGDVREPARPQAPGGSGRAPSTLRPAFSGSAGCPPSPLSGSVFRPFPSVPHPTFLLQRRRSLASGGTAQGPAVHGLCHSHRTLLLQPPCHVLQSPGWEV